MFGWLCLLRKLGTGSSKASKSGNPVTYDKKHMSKNNNKQLLFFLFAFVWLALPATQSEKESSEVSKSGNPRTCNKKHTPQKTKPPTCLFLLPLFGWLWQLRKVRTGISKVSTSGNPLTYDNKNRCHTNIQTKRCFVCCPCLASFACCANDEREAVKSVSPVCCHLLMAVIICCCVWRLLAVVSDFH